MHFYVFETDFWLTFNSITCSQEMFSYKLPVVKEQMKAFLRLGSFPIVKAQDLRLQRIAFFCTRGHMDHDTFLCGQETL